MKNFDTFGVMIDMSRNAVMSKEGLEKFLPILAKMGYNCVMLYTEDTYEVNGEPYFGYLRGRYGKEEMKALDRYAASLGMTLIPCIQTLAHLNAFIRWRKSPVDCNDILLTDDERTYELIDRMFATLSECFSSHLVHIGMDEAHMLGRGNHLDRHGYEAQTPIMLRHLNRVREIAKKYGDELMIWSDMFFRPWNHGTYVIPQTKLPAEIVSSFPQDVIPMYWDYYQLEKRKYADMLDNHRQLSDRTWFAGGAWCWSGFAPYNRYSVKSMTLAVDACREKKVRNVIMTMWGDDGAECARFSMLPSLFYLAQYAKGERDEAKIKRRFRSFTGVEYDDFAALDLPNEAVPYEGHPCNPSKYMLYSDVLSGFLDWTVKEGGGKRYAEIAERLHAVAKSTRKWGYLFDVQAKLCDVLAHKYEMGVNARKAYQTGDRETLLRIAEEEIPTVVKGVRSFKKAFYKQWMSENKPEGFEVQDYRLGGLCERLEAVRIRLIDYLNGKDESIPELEEAILPYENRAQGESVYANKALHFASVNTMIFGFCQ